MASNEEKQGNDLITTSVCCRCFKCESRRWEWHTFFM